MIPDHRPHVPPGPPGVGLIGAGAIARSAHLPAYARWGIPVVAIASRTASSARALAAEFGVATVHDRVEDLLADPAVAVVDIATGPRGRVDLIAAAVAAGKHVLAQKPLVLEPDEADRLEGVLALASARGIRVAGNMNARWAPPWRVATLLVRAGEIGEIVGVTHLHDKPLPPLAGTPFDDVPHMLVSDYLAHWIDISRCWLEGSRVVSVSAHDSRVPGQPADARNPWQAGIHIAVSSGATAAVRVVGDARTRSGGCPFWIHGTEGTIRGSVLRGSDHVELERGDERVRIDAEGEWFTDGFAGAMGELLTAVAEDREPENAAAHVLVSARLGMAASASAENGGVPERPAGLELTRSAVPEETSR
ncbi:Gfo/Idh/MocA family protein [Microbacterium lushaniae]|uniref:Gfo/Idh/MocA family oxidoreductase n=1 Tax=Microbacterium lushaniae TaxID=2614639 RepID=A0A5J6L5T8_9MICO|nr:Gfo/Idh/MocA family oxidoreductase [Microbacterium lushaniae]QEW03810.1 Gfo/Idh/MocA family oxidoreductase [Microbacterium lushaniae]